MDSQCSNLGLFNPIEFKALLEVNGNLLKRLVFRKSVKIAKEFYDDYVKWCEKNGKYIDFIEPMYWCLANNDVPKWIIIRYLKIVGDNIQNHLKNSAENG